jgi:hypothetical protein
VRDWRGTHIQKGRSGRDRGLSLWLALFRLDFLAQFRFCIGGFYLAIAIPRLQVIEPVILIPPMLTIFDHQGWDLKVLALERF